MRKLQSLNYEKGYEIKQNFVSLFPHTKRIYINTEFRFPTSRRVYPYLLTRLMFVYRLLEKL
jgi:hypothetical protein